MSTALAISGVTAVLQFYLGNVFSSLTPLFGGTVSVTAQAPDLVQSSLGGGGTPENQVNLFMHQVTHNAGWRNADLPSLSRDGAQRLTSPPLALDLHYLLTVYGSVDWQAEALLGYALMMLHENPVLTRDDIRHALAALPAQYNTNPLSLPLGSSELADQVEMIKILPAPLGREEMAWLWTALKADYRPTYPFQVSVVLMQPQRNASLSWPVLSRQLQVQAMNSAKLLEVLPPDRQSAAASGDTVTAEGLFLTGAKQVILSNPRFAIQLPVPLTSGSSTSLTFLVPNDPVNFPAGVYSVAAQFVDASGAVVQTSNSLPVAVAPVLPTQIAHVTSNPDGLLVKVDFTPNARPGQNIALAIGSAVATAQSFPASVGTLSFQFPATLPTGAQIARLIVDGVSSQLQVDWTATPPSFLGPMVTI